MNKEKIEAGDIKPIYTITGFQVCKVASDNPEEAMWVSTERHSEAEILSFIYQQGIPVEPSGIPVEPSGIPSGKRGRLKKKPEEPDAPISDADL